MGVSAVSKGKYKVYHILGKKIGCTTNIQKRVVEEQGFKPGEYDILFETDDIKKAADAERQLQKDLGYKVINEEIISTQRLDDILVTCKVPNKTIDLLDIDVEGYDFQVLKSIDLNLFHVKVILIETGENENSIIKYLSNYNYSIYKKIDRNIFFLKNSL